ncbi:MAG TPA: acyl carrier protein [Thermoguttaceae bacterium]|nr:acyl carrier protein [Thermoguttaceae bacterium]
MDNMLDQMQEVFRDVFDDDELTLAEEMTALDIDGWDSLMHINLIIAVERRFGVKFATAEISGLKADDQNVGTFCRLVAKKVDEKA